MKINADIKYIKSWKKEELKPRFAKVSLARKSGTTRLKRKIAKLVKETRKELRSAWVNLRTTLDLILFNAIIKQTSVAVKSRIKAITYRHEEELNNLRKLQQNYISTKTKQHPVKDTLKIYLTTTWSRLFYLFQITRVISIVYQSLHI